MWIHPKMRNNGSRASHISRTYAILLVNKCADANISSTWAVDRHTICTWKTASGTQPSSIRIRNAVAHVKRAPYNIFVSLSLSTFFCPSHFFFVASDRQRHITFLSCVAVSSYICMYVLCSIYNMYLLWNRSAFFRHAQCCCFRRPLVICLASLSTGLSSI